MVELDCAKVKGREEGGEMGKLGVEGRGEGRELEQDWHSWNVDFPRVAKYKERQVFLKDKLCRKLLFFLPPLVTGRRILVESVQ